MDRGCSRFFEKSSSLLANTSITHRIVIALERLTGCHDIAKHTLIPYARFSDRRHIVKATRAWCGDCFNTQRECGEYVFEPLIWQVAPVKICPIHHSALSVYCPKCRRPITMLTRSCQIGFCPICSTWLGQSVPRLIINDPFEMWVARELGSLVALSPTLIKDPHGDPLTASLKKVVAEQFGGNGTAFACATGLPKQTCGHWLGGRSRISLDNILHLSYVTNTPLPQMLTEEAMGQIDADRVAQRKRAASLRKTKHIVDPNQLKLDFESQLAQEEGMATVEKMAKRTGVAKKTLRKYLPEECQSLALNHASLKAEKKNTRIEQTAQLALQITNNLTAQGLYPSQERIETAMGKGASLREGEIKTRWKELIAAQEGLFGGDAQGTHEN